MQIIFLSGTKCLWLAQYVNQFLVWHKKCGPAQNILGPVKGQGIRFYILSPCWIHFDYLLTQKNFCWLPSKNEVADKKTDHCNLTKKFVWLWKCKFSSATLFLEGSHLNFSSPKKFVKWNQIRITNILLQRPQVRFEYEFKWRILSRTSLEESGKNEKKNFSYWASSTPWGHVLSLKTFSRNPVLSWAIRYSVFQKVKSTTSLEFVCGNPFSTFWHLMVKFG